MERKSKMEELDYQLNIFSKDYPANRIEIPISFQKSLEFVGFISSSTNKDYYESDKIKLWVSASLPIIKKQMQ